MKESNTGRFKHFLADEICGQNSTMRNIKLFGYNMQCAYKNKMSPFMDKVGPMRQMYYFLIFPFAITALRQ